MATSQKPSSGGSDTAHLYEGKTARSTPPSRRKAAGRITLGTELPEDAIPDVHIPSFVESLFGGPLVPKMKFLPAARSVQNLQIGAAAVMVLLAVLTYIVTPVSGTPWFWMTNALGIAWLGLMIHLLVILLGIVAGFWGLFQRDQRFLLASYIFFILVSLRFAASKVSFDLALLPEGEMAQKLLLIMYAVCLVMYMELSNGVIRFSILDTSIRTQEVYVMNEKRILSRYYASLLITPIVAGAVALITLLVNLIVPAIVRMFDPIAALRLGESVELTSVYGVALGTMIVFLIVAGMFGLNMPLRIQQFRERGE